VRPRHPVLAELHGVLELHLLDLALVQAHGANDGHEAARRQHGSLTTLYHKGNGSFAASKVLGERFFNLFGGATHAVGRYCGGEGDLGTTQSFGACQIHDPLDLSQNTRLFLLWGRNPAVTNIHMMPIIKEARARGALAIVIDPIETKTVKYCDRGIQLRPGSDGHLAIGMAKVILARRPVEGERIASISDCFDDYLRLVDAIPMEEIVGRTDLPLETIEWLALMYHDTRPATILQGIGLQQYTRGAQTYRLIARDGKVAWIRDEAVIVRDADGTARWSQGVMQDITEQKKAEEQAAFLAYHDKLTGLPNQAMFEEFLERAVSRANRHELAVAVLWVDLDDFKLVNDSLGHRAGDDLIRAMAARLADVTRETDLVARRGGDEFLLLLGDLERGGAGDVDASLLTAEAVAGRVMESLRVPFELEGTEVFVSASIGISVCPLDADHVARLLQNAETAMYNSKRSGPGGYVVSSAGTLESLTKLSFVTRLRRAVEGRHWEQHYQPIVDLGSGQILGVEALIRWKDPAGELIMPGEFIPLAEELGLIGALCDWGVSELVRNDRDWREDGVELRELSFNLSARQFWQPDLVDRIIRRLDEGEVDPRRVVVEITESSAMKDPERAQYVLWELHSVGLRLAIDDFGTGYSSLWRLRNLPVDVLKIDRSFVSGVHQEPEAASIVAAFVQLGRGLGKATLAEGIETEDEARFLATLGCQLGQGFFFGRPVPAKEITARIQSGELQVAKIA